MNPNDFQPQQPVQPDPPQPQVYASQPVQPTQSQPQPQGFTAPQTSSQPFAAQQPYITPAPSPNKKRLIIIIVATVIAVAVITGLVFLLTQKKDSGNANGSGKSLSSGSSSSSATTKKSACQLFTLTDAQAIMGSSVTSDAPFSNTSGIATISNCSYSGKGAIRLVSVNMTVYSDKSASDKLFSLEQATDKGANSVSDVGDRASWPTTLGLLVQKGNVVFSIHSFDQNSKDSQSIDTQVANAMLKNF